MDVKSISAVQERAAPPQRVAVLALRACVAGMMLLPLLTPVVVGSGAPPFRQPIFVALACLWLGLFLGAFLLAGVRASPDGR